MAESTSTSLIPINAVGDLMRETSQGALISGSLSNAATGRTLDQVYSRFGRAIEEKTNRAAHGWGMGPAAIVERIDNFFGTGEQRMVKLGELRTNGSPWVEKRCAKLVEYSLPRETAKTQVQAFKGIITVITRYPGTRAIILKSKHLARRNTPALISAPWARSDDELPSDWNFYCNFTAAALSETDVSEILANVPLRFLGSVQLLSGALSVIDRLRIMLECSGLLTVVGALALRYLAGVLEMPTFWVESGSIHAAVFTKLLNRLILVLKDLGLDLVDNSESGSSFDGVDTAGVDSLVASVLNGMVGWSKIERKEQYWCRVLTEVIGLLRCPLAETILPWSWKLSRDPDLTKIIPQDTREVVDILMAPADGSPSRVPAEQSDNISIREIHGVPFTDFVQDLGNSSGSGPATSSVADFVHDKHTPSQWTALGTDLVTRRRWSWNQKARLNFFKQRNQSWIRQWLRNIFASPERGDENHAAEVNDNSITSADVPLPSGAGDEIAETESNSEESSDEGGTSSGDAGEQLEEPEPDSHSNIEGTPPWISMGHRISPEPQEDADRLDFARGSSTSLAGPDSSASTTTGIGWLPLPVRRRHSFNAQLPAGRFFPESEVATPDTPSPSSSFSFFSSSTSASQGSSPADLPVHFHVGSHAGVRPHLCPLCQYSFTTMAVMKRHQRECKALPNSDPFSPLLPQD